MKQNKTMTFFEDIVQTMQKGKGGANIGMQDCMWGPATRGAA